MMRVCTWANRRNSRVQRPTAATASDGKRDRSWKCTNAHMESACVRLTNINQWMNGIFFRFYKWKSASVCAHLQLRNANNSKDIIHASLSLLHAISLLLFSATDILDDRWPVDVCYTHRHATQTANKKSLTAIPINCSQISFQHFSTALFLKRARLYLCTFISLSLSLSVFICRYIECEHFPIAAVCVHVFMC